MKDTATLHDKTDHDAFYRPGIALHGAVVHVNVGAPRALTPEAVRRDLETGECDKHDIWLLKAFYDETSPLSFVQMIAAGDITWEALASRLHHHLEDGHPNRLWIDHYV